MSHKGQHGVVTTVKQCTKIMQTSMEWNAIAKADTVPYLVGLVCCSVAVGDRGAV